LNWLKKPTRLYIKQKTQAAIDLCLLSNLIDSYAV
jgi:hypothetical protein